LFSPANLFGQEAALISKINNVTDAPFVTGHIGGHIAGQRMISDQVDMIRTQAAEFDRLVRPP